MPTWTCTNCQKPITGPGWLWIEPRAALDVLVARREWKSGTRPPGLPDHLSVVTLDQLVAYPAPEKWHATHEYCTPSEDETFGFVYSIPMSDARSYQRLLWWTTHLESKNWIVATDWRDLMQACAEQPVAA